MPMIIGYPRSGNNFTRYIIRHIANKEVGYAHGNQEAFWTNPKIGPRIFVLRNYKECIPRHLAFKTFERIIDQLQDLNSIDYLGKNWKDWKGRIIGPGMRTDYISLIRYYDEYPDKKMMIYYEDLITDTSTEVRRINDFLNSVGMPSNCTEFLDDLKNHAKTSRKQYHEPCFSGGDKVLYHSKEIPEEDRKKVDEYLKAKFPEIFEKYLKRYSE
jgi:hypothetical protein